MARQNRVHRASAQRRRAALVDAAAALVAEVGAGAVTHRAVAARAGVPLSTTSYFFDSIDELVAEALGESVKARVAGFDQSEKIWVERETEGPEAMIQGVVDEFLATSRVTDAGRVEAYLASGRDPEFRDEVTSMVSRLVERAIRQLDRAGVPRAESSAWMFRAILDGAMLHRVAGLDADHGANLTQGFRLALAASMLTDQEADELLARYGEQLLAAQEADAAEAEAIAADSDGGPDTEPAPTSA